MDKVKDGANVFMLVPGFVITDLHLPAISETPAPMYNYPASSTARFKVKSFN